MRGASRSAAITRMDSHFSLDKLEKGRAARIVAFADRDPDLVVKLREIGFAEEDEVELLAVGLIGGTPLSVRLNRTIIALRRSEAAHIEVEPVS